ncbi:MAG: FAD-dependent monooxygenase [Magnetospirillum sp.]|nr:FAD-dependent monooxygenase [Magnetospirillum sp.]
MEKFDAIVVGAGPSGNSAAYTMAKAGLKVLQVERGEYSGSKNVQGAILYATSLEKIIPDFREDAPLERHIVEQRLWMLDDKSHCGTHYRSDKFNEERPNRYTIVRAQFDKWFNSKVREAGALVVCETTVTELARDADGKVVGIKTDRDDEVVHADVVVLADGVNSLVGQRSGIRPEIKPEHAALAVKEMHFLPREVIDQRFNIKGEEGVVIEALGTVTMGLMGTAFLYTNGESVSVGIGCLVSDFRDSGTSPYVMLDKFKKHPLHRPPAGGLGGEGIRRPPDPRRRIQGHPQAARRRLADRRRFGPVRELDAPRGLQPRHGDRPHGRRDGDRAEGRGQGPQRSQPGPLPQGAGRQLRHEGSQKVQELA